MRPALGLHTAPRDRRAEPCSRAVAPSGAVGRRRPGARARGDSRHYAAIARSRSGVMASPWTLAAARLMTAS